MKKFLIKLSYTVLPLWLLVSALVAFYHLQVQPNIHGELGRLGKMQFAPEKMNVDVHEKFYTDIDNLQQLADTTVDVLTVGDSFSQQGVGSYENFIAMQGYSVINLHADQNMFQTAYDMMNLGVIDSSRVKTIVVECVERYLPNRVTTLKTGNKSVSFSPIGRRNGIGDESVNNKSREWSLLEARNYLMLRLGLPEPVKHCTLAQPMFSSNRGKELFFYYEDLNSFSLNQEQQKVAAQNISRINHLADSLGINIVYLVCPDKYDIYQDLIVDNPYPHKTVNEDFAASHPSPERLLLGKEVLMPLVKKGVKDIFHLSSTHWSYASAQAVASRLVTMLPKPRNAAANTQ